MKQPKKKQSSGSPRLPVSAVKPDSFENTLMQDAGWVLFGRGVTSKPAMSFLRNDHGAVDEIYRYHMEDPAMLQIRRMAPDTWHTIFFSHALGTGAYMMLCQDRYGMPAEQFGPDEMEEILEDVEFRNAYELGLTGLGIPFDSDNKKTVDGIIAKIRELAEKAAGGSLDDPALLKVCTRVFFNAGVTLAVRP